MDAIFERRFTVKLAVIKLHLLGGFDQRGRTVRGPARITHRRLKGDGQDQDMSLLIRSVDFG